LLSGREIAPTTGHRPSPRSGPVPDLLSRKEAPMELLIWVKVGVLVIHILILIAEIALVIVAH
jgi:hypothetical protein